MRTEARQKTIGIAMRVALEMIAEGRLGNEDSYAAIRGLIALHRAAHIPLTLAKETAAWPKRSIIDPEGPEEFLASIASTSARAIAEQRCQWDKNGHALVRK